MMELVKPQKTLGMRMDGFCMLFWCFCDNLMVCSSTVISERIAWPGLSDGFVVVMLVAVLVFLAVLIFFFLLPLLSLLLLLVYCLWHF